MSTKTPKTTNRTTDSFYRHLREWFTVFLPRQRGASPHTITACRHTWNMLLGYVAETRGVPLSQITFTVLDRACVIGFLDHMRDTRGWTAATYNQRLACIRSFFKYAATAEPTLAMHLVDLSGIPQLKAPVTPTIRYLTTTAITALLATPDPTTKKGLRDQFFMILMYDLAARDAEMLALTPADIDTKRLTVDLIGKGSKPRRLPITTETAAHYRRYTAAFHADPETTLIYAHADTEMKRQALAKATGGISAGPPPLPIWHDQEDIIQRLCGLTN